ncbi:transposable element Tcb2 transposase [Trichonephila clavipes]|nr:transposable element Tcb2 transposase [Trichonephila clavipes]
MPCRRKGAKFEQISEFERGRIVGLRESGLSYRAVATRVQRNSSTIMRVLKQWTDEGRTARKFGSGPRNVTSAHDDRRLVRMAQTDLTASSRQLAAQWSTTTGVSLCASSIRRRLLQRVGCAQGFLYTGFLSRKTIATCGYNGQMRIGVGVLIGSRSFFLTNPASICGTMMAEFVSGAMPVNGTFRSALSNATVDEHPELWSGPQDIPFLQGLPGAVFQQDNARPHVAKTVKSYLDSQQVQLLPWPAYSPDMSPIEHVWDIVRGRLARDLRPVVSTDELWLRIKTIWNTLQQADIQNLFNSMPRRVAALIAARSGHTKY